LKAIRVVSSLAVLLAFMTACGGRVAGGTDGGTDGGNDPGSIRTGDGVRLELSPEGGVTAVSIGSTALTLVGQGGFAVADFKNQPEPVNLVPNPGFEDGTAGWTLTSTQFLDTSIFHTGGASVRIEVPGPAAASSSLGITVPVKPFTRYLVGMWVRRELVGRCGAYSSERDDQGNLTGKTTQVSSGIPAKDGEWLPIAWEIATEAATTRLLVRADIYQSTGTLWLDDFFVHEVIEGLYRPVRGEISADAGKTAFHGKLTDAGLDLDATLAADAESIRIEGVIQDTTGQDRAVGVRFALPLDLTGWTWHHDAESHEPIVPGSVRRLTYRSVSGIGVTSIYPWSALSGPEVGLSLALPLDQGPRVFVLQHDQRAPETSITFFFGLTKDALKNPSRATFSFVIFRHDPAWGMRSAMARYYKLFPESFKKRPAYEGYLNYGLFERFDPATHELDMRNVRVVDASDFGEGYNFLWHLHGCYDYRQHATADTTMPSDETVYGWLQDLVEAENGGPWGYTPTSELLKKIVFGPKGEISYIADTKYWQPHEGYNHTDQAGWGLNFRVNEDPGVSSFLADMARSKAEAYANKANRRPWDSMFTADAIEGYMANSTRLDFRREHFATTFLPLTFGSETLAPGMPNTIWDFLVQSWSLLSDQYQILIHGNANCYEQFFTMPLIDVPMTEGDWDSLNPGRLDRFVRAIAYRKIWRYWDAWTPVENQLRRGLATSVYPAVYTVLADGEDTGDTDEERALRHQYRALLRQYVPAIEELSSSGWDPIPYAHADGGIVIERYGTYADGELHFTLRNYSDGPADTVLTLDRAGLGIREDASLLWQDILPRVPRFSEFPAAGLPVHLEKDGTLALWVGTRDQAAQHGFRLAAKTIEKIERFYQGVTEMGDTARATWNAALEDARNGAAGNAGDGAALAENLQRAADKLGTEITTNAKVDLAKLLLRLRGEVSFVPVSTYGMTVIATRLVEGCTPGGKTQVILVVKADAATGFTNLEATVLSPWGDVASQCTVALPFQEMAPGASLDLQAELYIPALPERPLLPYLVVLTGETQGGQAQPFTLAIPVDLLTAL
jgi:hypothetical protein